MTAFSGFPHMAYVRQQLVRSGLADIEGVVATAIRRENIPSPSNLGETVAVAVGSRRIDGLAEIVGQCLRELERMGYAPFVLSAMGSHGGATADGQKEILAKLGITASRMGTRVVADMQTRAIAELEGGERIYFSSAALAADHLVVINRIKPHTKFKADIESGLCKMLTIGLGNARGAAAFHRLAVRNSFTVIETAAARVLKQVRLLFGIALMEDGYGRLAHAQVLRPETLIFREKQLLKEAYRMMARLPFDDIDVLIVDVIGKDISGIGMDSNVTGRHRDLSGDFFSTPRVARIFVRDLSPGSAGNANGIGLADFTTTRLVSRIDLSKTFVNAVTAISPEKGAIPIHFETDRQCLEACINTCGVSAPDKVKIVRIRDTAHLDYIQVSRAYASEADALPILERMGDWRDFKFDPSGNLADFDPHENA
jgi:hypothetical protein